MAAAAKTMGWHWSEYWRSGRQDVMTVDSAQGRTGFDAEAMWRAYFDRFGDGAKLLDLATGAGQVARYAAAAAEAAGRRCEITGVDYADLGPHAQKVPAACRLVGGVALEKLPFAEASFDGASSQYGIEYADARGALTELARVLKPGAPALLLMHHAASAISRSAAAQLAAHEKVLGEGSAVRLGRRVFAAHLKGQPPAAIRAAEEAFREAVARASARLEPTGPYEMVRQAVLYLADLSRRAAAYAPQSALERLDVFEADNAAWRHRQRAQLKAAMDARGLDAFLERAGRCGLAVEERAEETDARGELVGWRVRLRRS